MSAVLLTCINIVDYCVYHTTIALTHWGQDKMAAILAVDIFKCISLNENVWISNKISLTFVSEVPIYHKPALIQVMAWRLTGDKPLSESMMACFTDALFVIRPQWVKSGNLKQFRNQLKYQWLKYLYINIFFSMIYQQSKYMEIIVMEISVLTKFPLILLNLIDYLRYCIWNKCS